MNSSDPSVKIGLEISGTGGRPVLTLIHGFAGSHKTWHFVRPIVEHEFQLALLDLPGHGEVPPQANISLPRIAETIATFLAQSVQGPKYLCGYSMGSRIALHIALNHPGAADKLALIGASPGFPSEQERTTRRESDGELARNIRSNGISWFADYWPTLPIFASQTDLPPETRDWLRGERLANDPEGLALALEQWGTGQQEWLLPKLGGLRCPTLLLSGARDEKFSQLCGQMAEAIPDCTTVAIPDAGHAAHIERPEAVARELITFFTPNY
jgi:2-succinyl-6-hydroxy-2,4-cyclohexadiene-1-carboxylate synthase